SAVVAGKVYAVGGRGPCPPCTAFNILEVYDPSSNSWATKASMPVSCAGLAAVGLNGKLYVLGGANSANTALQTLQVYDPVSNFWTILSPMPTGRQGLGAVAVDDLIFAINGQTSSGVTNLVEVYDPA